jgi:N-acetylglucosaminyl-diphospho-decaprenol L-rhamnosyltransferase
MITVSIVSHNHGAMLSPLVERLLRFPEIEKIIITFNIPELVDFPVDDCIRLIHNDSPKGFGTNHNQAFSFCSSQFFCVLNPDIFFGENPFPELLQASSDDIGLVAPIVKNLDGEIEDSVRRFPSPLSILRRKLFGYQDGYSYVQGDINFYPEWVGGMFMLFKSSAYSDVNGFDEAYFMYVEDVDICTRLWRARHKVLVCPSTAVFHDARRASRKSLQHLRWHIAGLLRYFQKYSFPMNIF